MPGAHSRRAVPEDRRTAPIHKATGNSATRGSKKQKKGISGCSAVGARSRAPPAAETARRKCWAAMRAMQGRAKAAAARHMATGSAPRAVVKNRRKEYRGVAQLVHVAERRQRRKQRGGSAGQPCERCKAAPRPPQRDTWQPEARHARQ